MNYQETQYGFDYGSAKVERHMSDEKKGWIVLGIRTPKIELQIYVTKTGRVRIYNYGTGKEFIETTIPERDHK